MLKRRLIFTLLFNDGNFMLSRNFRLQKVGNLEWICSHYDLSSIAFAIDELVVLNVGRTPGSLPAFTDALKNLGKMCFMPMAAGGGITSMDEAFALFDAGADKVVVNTALVTNKPLVATLVKTFGSQSVVGSIDYRRTDTGTCTCIDGGKTATAMSVDEAAAAAAAMGVGELFVTSCDRDGTGQGYDIETMRRVVETSPVPVIISGGVGKFDQLLEGIVAADAPAVSTANLFNFMGDGLSEARAYLREHGIDVAEWEVLSHDLQFVSQAKDTATA